MQQAHLRMVYAFELFWAQVMGLWALQVEEEGAYTVPCCGCGCLILYSVQY